MALGGERWCTVVVPPCMNLNAGACRQKAGRALAVRAAGREMKAHQLGWGLVGKQGSGHQLTGLNVYRSGISHRGPLKDSTV